MQSGSIVKWLKTNPLDATLMLSVGLIGLASGLWAKNIILDDAMITFRVAENLAYGQGFVYNVGERIQVTTTPLYAMVLAIGTWIFGSAPRAALPLNITLATLIPILAYDVGRRIAGRVTGIGGALLLTFAPLLVIAFSMESYLYVTLILASMDAYVGGRYRLAGVLIGFTTLVRGDAVLMGAGMLIYDLVARRRLYWRLIIPAVSIPAGWYLFAILYYGSPFPATLQAKTAQGEFDWLGQHFLSGFLGYWNIWVEDYSPVFYLFPLLIILGLGCAIWKEHLWLILIARDVLYITAFIGLGVTFAEWYYAPIMPGLALITARGIQVVVDGITNLTIRILNGRAQFLPRLISVSVATILILTLLSATYPVTADIVAANPDWKAKAYPDAARWITQNTNSAANLATIDIGHLGYWSKRPIIDIVGLAQPDIAPHIAEGDFGYAIREYEPDMVLIGASWLPEIQSKDWFQADYLPRHALKLDGLDEPLVLFTRPEGVKVQEHIIPTSEIQPLDVDFNRQISLTGLHLNEPLTSGQALNLTLFWQVNASIPVDFTVFVQLVGADNTILAQSDSKPQQGFYPTPYWQPGEHIVDSYTLPLGANISPGSYDLLLGLYEAENGTRLQILDEEGEFKSDHVRLAGVQVQAP